MTITPVRALSLETRRLYARDWAEFAAWCRMARQAALPAASATVAAYLCSLPALRHGSLSRRVAAIAAQHRHSGHAAPLAGSQSRALLRSARLAAPRMGATRLPLPGPDQLIRMAARCAGDLAGQRDRALLLLAAGSHITREQLCALDQEHIRFTADGVVLRGLGNGAGAVEGAVIVRRAGPSCPVRALETWLARSDTRFGPVFRKIDRWGNVEHARLRPDGLRRIWRRRAA